MKSRKIFPVLGLLEIGGRALSRKLLCITLKYICSKVPEGDLDTTNQYFPQHYSVQDRFEETVNRV